MPCSLSPRLTALSLAIALGTWLVAPPASARCVGAIIEAASDGNGQKPTCASSHITVPEGRGKTYRVGPGRPLGSLADVPWSALTAGDTVLIHHRAEPYREKILISGRGTPEQWIRVLGVPGPNGELPVISGDGAVTAKTVRFRWSKPDVIEWLGVIHIAVGVDKGDDPGPLPPAFVEIANLQVQDATSTYRFQSGDGSWHHYSGFAACIYARSVAHVLIRNNVLTNCGQGFYNWTGDGSSPSWWAAVQSNTVISGNHFHNNGSPGSYLEHQVYTESDGVVIEYNRFGPQRSGALGSQIKDRSAGTVIRYNTLEQSPEGWDMDLVEPEESWPVLAPKPQLRQTFVYGNVIVSRGVYSPNFVHWNEDHQAGHGRATLPDGQLFFYHNTIVIHPTPARDKTDPYYIFNGTWGGYECPDRALPGVIDVRNNLIVVIPSAQKRQLTPIRLGYCRKEKIALGANWISPSVLRDGNVTGWSKTIAPTDNAPGFASPENFRLKEGSSAAAAGAKLAHEIRDNALGIDLTPKYRFIDQFRLQLQSKIGDGANLGAF